jgi:hypothetical protein
MLTRLRDILHKRELARFRETNIHLTEPDHFSKLRTIGITFDAAEDFEPIMTFKKQLEQHEFEVTLLGYFNTREDPGVQRFNYFTNSTLNFKKVPTSEVTLKFIETPFDILINLDLNNNLALNYVAAASAALFKVGKAGNNTDFYDLMIELSNGGKVGQFIQEIRHTVNSMN